MQLQTVRLQTSEKMYKKKRKIDFLSAIGSLSFKKL